MQLIERSPLKEVEVNYVFSMGGLGDYLGYLSCMKWINDTQLHVDPVLYVHNSLLTICKAVLPRFRVKDIERLPGDEKKLECIMGPHEYPNATGFHQVDIGFMYYGCITTQPEYYNYVQLDFSQAPRANIDQPYAVITPGHTTKNRSWRASAMNAVSKHLKERGILPVYLGASSVGKRNISFDPDYDFSYGLNLIDQTTMWEAAKIINDSEMIIGLDNGLLHLAGMTKAPIIFGYNIASPEHRRPRRSFGEIIDIYPDKKELPCTFCQSEMRFVKQHNFRWCLYKDDACLDILGRPEEWIKAVDKILDKSSS